MKNTLLILAIISIVGISCTKTPSSNLGGGGTGYGCYCYWIIYPGHDTSTTFSYPADTGSTKASSACGVKDTWVKSLSGKTSGAYCKLN